MRRDRALVSGLALILSGLAPTAALAEVKLPAIFGPHMVLQRDQKDRVWEARPSPASGSWSRSPARRRR